MSSKPQLTVLKGDSLPFEVRAARVLGVESLPPLPTVRDEEFHFTNLRPITALKPLRGSDWELAEVARVLPVVQGPQVVIVNGRVVEQLSVLERLKDVHVTWDLEPHPNAPLMTDSLSIWNNAQGGHSVTIHSSSLVDVTLHVIHVLAGDEVPTGGRIRVIVARGHRLTLVEHVVGLNGSCGWLNIALEVDVASQATLEHVVIQNLPVGSALTRWQGFMLFPDSTLRQFTLQAGGVLSRLATSISTMLRGNVKVSGMSLSDSGQTHDTTIRLTHYDEATRSHIRQRNILRGESSHAVFQGKFYVAPKAQKTDAYMLCESLLLAEGARVSAKPELEIYADDVKCSHGASTGSINPDQMFYLAARGVPEVAAKRLLVSAFAEELLAEVPDAAKSLVTAQVNAWLDGAPALPADDVVDTGEWLS